MFLTPPSVWGCLPFICTPTLCCCFSVHWYVLGILVCYVGICPSVEGFRGVPPSVGGFGGISTWDVHMLILVIFLVHYVSCFYYVFDYYSTSYSGIFWAVFSLLSGSGSFLDRVSSKLGSAWSDSTTTLDAKSLWRCSWLGFCATTANALFNASSGLCQLCYGFSTGRFLFRVESPTILYIICLVSILMSAFYF